MVFDAKELVVTNKNGKMTGNGYTIESLLMHSGISPMLTGNDVNTDQKGGSSSIGVGGKFSDLFRSMGIPVGLSYALSNDVMNGADSGNHKTVTMDKESNGMVADSLYDKLLELAGPPQKNVDDSVSYVGTGGSNKKHRRQTKRKSNKAKRQTRRKHKKSNSKK